MEESAAAAAAAAAPPPSLAKEAISFGLAALYRPADAGLPPAADAAGPPAAAPSAAEAVGSVGLPSDAELDSLLDDAGGGSADAGGGRAGPNPNPNPNPTLTLTLTRYGGLYCDVDTICISDLTAPLQAL